MYALGYQNTMNTNGKPLGESFRNYFKVGDLVTWRLYTNDSHTGEIVPRQMTGVIVDIYRSPMSGREVWFAKVFEASSGSFYNMSLMTLSLLKD